MRLSRRFNFALLVSAALLPLPLCAATPLGSISSSPGKADVGIAAVVGEEAISSFDVDNRLRFVITTARLANTPDVLKVIRPQVIRSLIDEKLQMQEASRLGMKVEDDDLKEAIEAIEQQRGMPAGTIIGMLASSNIPKETFEQQIRSQLVWNRILTRKVRPNVHVSEEEVSIAARKFSVAPPKKEVVPQEYKIGVIALPMEKPDQERTIGQLAFKLVQQIRSGASFEEVARQFSSATASSGGKVETFWVRPGQLDAGVAQSLDGAQTGTVTNPVRTAHGFTIVKVYETRDIPGKKPKVAPKPEEIKDTQVTFKEILIKVKPDADEKESDVMLQIGGEVAKNPGTCEDKTIASIDALADYNIEVNFVDHILSEMPEGLAEFATKLKQGEISPPVLTYEGIRLYMLCGKKEAGDKPVNRDVVYSALLQQKMDLEAQKYLRNLRRSTFIEVRQ